MEGELWKWTNYWNGWQSRWFILEDGILSYYKSYDEVSQGCKGSINVSVCEIVVSSTDHTRLDLIISGGEQYLYLRASSETERQRWLIALGSAKACLGNRPRRQRMASNSSVSSDVGIPVPSTDDSTSLKTKKSELRLYSDLLMQQVHMVKGAVKPDGAIGVTQLDEGTSLLPQTCDMFMRTLESVMKLTDAGFVYTVSNARVGDPAAESAMMHHSNGMTRKTSRGSISMERSCTPVNSSSRRRRPSTDSISSRISPTLPQVEESPSPTATTKGKERGFHSVFGVNNSHSESPKDAGFSPEATPMKSNHSTPHREEESLPVDKIEEEILDVDLLATTVGPKFPLPVIDYNIETDKFLAASNGILNVYSFLGTPQFLELKQEAENLLIPIRSKFLEDPKHFEYLGLLVNDDPNDRLFSRSLKDFVDHLTFLNNFLRHFLESKTEEDMPKCLLSSIDQNFELSNVEKRILKLSKDLKLSRIDFLGKFFTSESSSSSSLQVKSPSSSTSSLQAKLFPPLEHYLDSMDPCLEIVVSLVL